MQSVAVHTGGGNGVPSLGPGERFYHGKCKKALTFDRIEYTPHR